MEGDRGVDKLAGVEPGCEESEGMCGHLCKMNLEFIFAESVGKPLGLLAEKSFVNGERHVAIVELDGDESRQETAVSVSSVRSLRPWSMCVPICTQPIFSSYRTSRESRGALYLLAVTLAYALPQRQF